ncbi:MAG: hypothetical protein AAF556_04035 [Pseudomonadota bacterium]
MLSPEERIQHYQSFNLDRWFYWVGSIIPGYDRRVGLFWPERYLLCDAIILGSNPILNAVLLQASVKRGFKTVFVPAKKDNDWPYQLCEKPEIQAIIERACGIDRHDHLAETQNTAFAYHAPSQSWSNRFFTHIASTLKVATEPVCKVPHRLTIDVDPETLQISDVDQTLLHVSYQISTGLEAHSEQEPEISLPRHEQADTAFADLQRGFQSAIPRLVTDLDIKRTPSACQTIIAPRILLTSSNKGFSRSSRIATRQSFEQTFTEFDYLQPTVTAFGSAAWATPEPTAAISLFVEDILTAARFGLTTEPDGEEQIDALTQPQP